MYDTTRDVFNPRCSGPPHAVCSTRAARFWHAMRAENVPLAVFVGRYSAHLAKRENCVVRLGLSVHFAVFCLNFSPTGGTVAESVSLASCPLGGTGDSDKQL